MNISEQTRKQQVLDYLSAHQGEWVNGTELANEAVGGSEGLRRVRDLRNDGYNVLQRRHPDPQRSVYQYLLATTLVKPLREADAAKPVFTIKRVEGPLGPVYPQKPKTMTFGETLICPRCNGKTNEPGAGRSVPCKRCGGVGLIPNVGAIPPAP